MGLFSNITDDFLGIDPSGGGIADALGFKLVTDPLEDAFKDITGQTAQEELKKTAEEQAKGLERFFDLLQPSIEAGQRQIEPLESAATVEGFGGGIGDILNSGALDPLIAQRQRSADALMAARGLRRSGAAVQEAANIPADLALSIESELNRRRQSLFGAGQTGIQNAGNLQGQIGQIIAGGQQAGLAARQAGLGNLLQLGGAALMA